VDVDPVAPAPPFAEEAPLVTAELPSSELCSSEHAARAIARSDAATKDSGLMRGA
jgi:hypothetical protein